MLVLFHIDHCKESTDLFQCHDHNHNYHFQSQNWKDKNDMPDLLRKQSRNLLNRILIIALFSFGISANLFISEAAEGSSNNKYLEIFKDHPYIFNLGHGITTDADPKNVDLLLECIRT